MKNKNKHGEYNLNEVLEYVSINKEKYNKRFYILERGKRKFNFSAAILGGFWLAFQFMFLEWSIVIIIQFIFEVGLNLLKAWTFDEHSILLLIDIVNILFNLFTFFFLGFFGDALLMANIRRKIAFQKKRKEQAAWIKIIYEHEKVMLFRIISVVILCGLFFIILGELAPKIYSAIIY